MSDLNNPMTVGIRHTELDVSEWLDHDNNHDNLNRRITKVVMDPNEGHARLHWEIVDE